MKDKDMVTIKIKDVRVQERTEYRGGALKARARLYIFPQETLLENLRNRRTRPYKEYRKLIPEIMEKAGLSELWKKGDIKASWSQYAGCSCPCSPGFILSGIYHKDIFVDVV